MQRILCMSSTNIFRLGTVACGPRRIRFSGINAVRNDDMTISTDANDKLESPNENLLTRVCQNQSDEQINDFEKSIFASTNTSLAWTGSAASPFCSSYASYLQQKNPHTNVHRLVEQRAILQKLRKCGAKMSYPRPSEKTTYG